MDLTPPRGTNDLLPPASERLLALYMAAARQAELFGYRYVETPAFEATDLFARTSGEGSDVVRKEMYTFTDKGGREISLRPEATAGIVRAYLANAHALPSPYKAYTIGPMWRYGRPQAGRLREFRQFDVEVLGAAEPSADVEVIALGHTFLESVGARELELQLNSIGDERCRPAYREILLHHLSEHVGELRDEHRERFRENPLRVLDCKDAACREVSRSAPRIVDRLCGPCREHFEAVQVGLKALGISFALEPTLVRGLDYYTRTAFEWVSQRLPEGQSSVGGAGRYDGLAELLGGPPTPGVGFAIGLERVLLAMDAEPGGERAFGLDCFVVAMGERARSKVGDLVGRLHLAGVSAATAFDDRSLKAHLRMADRYGARFVAVLGDREVEAGTITLRRLEDGWQEELGLEDAVALMTGEEGGRG